MNPHLDYDKITLQFLIRLRDAYANSAIADSAIVAELNEYIAAFEAVMDKQRIGVRR